MGVICTEASSDLALFISDRGAKRAGQIVHRKYPDMIKRTEIIRRKRRGQILGWNVIVHLLDGRPSMMLTSADYQHVTGA